MVILGDNFFYGQSLSDQIKQLIKKNSIVLFKKKKSSRTWGSKN